MIEHHGLFLNLETMKVNPIGYKTGKSKYEKWNRLAGKVSAK